MSIIYINEGSQWSRQKKDKQIPGLETIAITATKTGGILYSFV